VSTGNGLDSDGSAVIKSFSVALDVSLCFMLCEEAVFARGFRQRSNHMVTVRRLFSTDDERAVGRIGDEGLESEKERRATYLDLVRCQLSGV